MVLYVHSLQPPSDGPSLVELIATVQ